MHSAITLEQWLTFKTIVEEGSYARASEVLNKSQSSISYLITKLNDLLPVPVLVLQGRKTVLTDAGQVLYRQACNLLEQAQQLEHTATYFAKGWEDEVVIALDALASTSRVFCGLNEFSRESPLTRIRVLETTLSGTEEAILNKTADIAVTAKPPTGFLGEYLINVKMVPVAHPDHPLHALATITEQELKHSRQIVLRDTGIKRQQDAGWLGSEQRWTVSHFSSSVEAVKAGLGFAFIPEHKIQRELANGDLKPLNITPSAERVLPLYLVLTHQSHAGPASKAVASHLLRQFKADPASTKEDNRSP